MEPRLCHGASVSKAVPRPQLCSHTRAQLPAPAGSSYGPPQRHHLQPFRSCLASGRRQPHSFSFRAQDGDRKGTEEKPVKYSDEFGYSRKDVLLLGGGILALGYGLYYGLQAAGVEAGKAGNFVQAGVVFGLCIAWTASYILRVVNKDMTYSKQLDAYEEAVMQKRLDEMPETERQRLFEEIEAERAKKSAR
ncbi:hypothetical protein WJX73_000074 [Symbiochloris irregularis]|uniref:Uncharacterized protein n=1 Tax=Symbiochloris irregularis TaxID=706552 RepID=A0AAW1PBV8_9CHLO